MRHSPDEMLWLSQHQSLSRCQAEALGTQGCTADQTVKVIYQSGDVKNCYCLNTTSCTPTPSDWQDLYTEPQAAAPDVTPTSTGKIYASGSPDRVQ